MLYSENSYYNHKYFQLLELPYSRNETSFVVILPNEIDGLDALIEKLQDPSTLKLATSKIYTADVKVFLPKFKIETKTDLKHVLGKVSIISNIANQPVSMTAQQV